MSGSLAQCTAKQNSRSNISQDFQTYIWPGMLNFEQNISKNWRAWRPPNPSAYLGGFAPQTPLLEFPDTKTVWLHTRFILWPIVQCVQSYDLNTLAVYAILRSENPVSVYTYTIWKLSKCAHFSDMITLEAHTHFWSDNLDMYWSLLNHYCLLLNHY